MSDSTRETGTRRKFEVERVPFNPFEFLRQNEYNTGIFGCCHNPPIWLFSCCCTPIASGHLNGLMLGRKWSCSACFVYPIGIYRARRTIQKMHNYKECEDASTWAAICTPCCSLAQDYREWKYLTAKEIISPVSNPPAPMEVPNSDL